MNLQKNIEKSVKFLRKADALLITSGAGMGVDSGLPDFRGEKGFWNAYPMYEKLNLDLYQVATPNHFTDDPHFGWGFYGHRSNLYRKTEPHEGFSLLQKWIEFFGWDYFSVTSNVDGHFQKAGYPDDKIFEVHGSIHHMQCTIPCSKKIWDNDQPVEVDESTMRSLDVPLCRACGATARPNILMFNDFCWVSERSDEQRSLFSEFLEGNRFKNLVIIEIGAGSAVPTIRNISEGLSPFSENIKIIRINPKEPEISEPHVSLKCGGLEYLKLLDQILCK